MLGYEIRSETWSFSKRLNLIWSSRALIIYTSSQGHKHDLTEAGCTKRNESTPETQRMIGGPNVSEYEATTPISSLFSLDVQLRRGPAKPSEPPKLRITIADKYLHQFARLLCTVWHRATAELESNVLVYNPSCRVPHPTEGEEET